MNKSILSEPDFNVNFMETLNDIKSKQDYYESISEWFDLCFKPSIRNFLINFSKARNKSRKDTIIFYSTALQHAISQSDWETVAFARSKLSQFQQEDAMGLAVRSRYQENAEKERASLFHLNREVKKGKLSRIEKLAKKVKVLKNGNVAEERIFHHHHYCLIHNYL